MRKRRIVPLPPFWLFGFFLFAVSGCLTTQPKPDGIKLRIAVLDFVNHSRNHQPGLGDFFADRLTHELFKRKRYDLVERGEVTAALEGEKIGKPADELSTEEVKRLGKKLSADVLALGEITEYQVGDFESGPGRVGILVRMVSCSDGSLMAMEEARVRAKGDMISLSEKAVSAVSSGVIKPLLRVEKDKMAKQDPVDPSLPPSGVKKDK